MAPLLFLQWKLTSTLISLSLSLVYTYNYTHTHTHTHVRMSSTAAVYFMPCSMRATATSTGALPSPATQCTATHPSGWSRNVSSITSIHFLMISAGGAAPSSNGQSCRAIGVCVCVCVCVVIVGHTTELSDLPQLGFLPQWGSLCCKRDHSTSQPPWHCVSWAPGECMGKMVWHSHGERSQGIDIHEYCTISTILFIFTNHSHF